MLYFSQQPYNPRSQEELDQWGRVLAFKKEFEKAGLIWSYRGPARFEGLLRQHATRFLLDLHGRDPLPAEGTTSNAAVHVDDAEADAMLRALAAEARRGAGVLPAERVNALGAGAGLQPGAVLGAVERLRDRGDVRLHWGGGVLVAGARRGDPGR
jgi:hypothetical protein